MRRFGKGRADGGISEVDISPLIDMVFILLIFFIVSTTFIKDAELDIERPAAASATPANAQSLRIFIDRQGGITVDELPVRPWMVQARVREFLSRGADANVLVVADRRVAAESLIDVVDQARLAGASNVGVITDLEEG